MCNVREAQRVTENEDNELPRAGIDYKLLLDKRLNDEFLHSIKYVKHSPFTQFAMKKIPSDIIML